MKELPTTNSPDEWRTAAAIDAVVEYFVAQVNETDSFLVQLGQNPVSAIERLTDVTIVLTEWNLGGCSVLGRYDPSPPTITLSRSQGERDAFTVVHEFCHHLQAHDADWQDVLWRINNPLLLWIEEDVCNTFASIVLIPDSIARLPLSAGGLTEAYAATKASRQAIAIRAIKAAPQTEPTFVLICDVSGQVQFGCATDSSALAHPPRGSLQPDCADLIAEALESNAPATGLASHGITYTSGVTRHDITLDVSLDHTSRYAFVVGRREHRFVEPDWGRREVVCPSEACSETFEVTAAVTSCNRCHAPRCPLCGTCECEPQQATCSNCWLTLSTADLAAGRVQHIECP